MSVGEFHGVQFETNDRSSRAVRPVRSGGCRGRASPSEESACEHEPSDFPIRAGPKFTEVETGGRCPAVIVRAVPIEALTAGPAVGRR